MAIQYPYSPPKAARDDLSRPTSTRRDIAMCASASIRCATPVIGGDAPANGITRCGMTRPARRAPTILCKRNSATARVASGCGCVASRAWGIRAIRARCTKRSLVSTASTLVTDVLRTPTTRALYTRRPPTYTRRSYNKKPRYPIYPSNSSSSFAVSSGAGAGAGAVFAFFRRGAPGDRDDDRSVRA